MGFDQNRFNGVIIEFLSASVKNVDEIETCWRQMQASIGNMDEVINAYVLHWRLHTVDDDMKERLNRPKYIDCGPGKCGSTVVIKDGCKKAILPREKFIVIPWKGVGSVDRSKQNFSYPIQTFKDCVASTHEVAGGCTSFKVAL